MWDFAGNYFAFLLMTFLQSPVYYFEHESWLLYWKFVLRTRYLQYENLAQNDLSGKSYCWQLH